jgi:hypothetical protein
MKTSDPAFESFLHKKNVDPEAFLKGNPRLFQRFAFEYAHAGESMLEYGRKFFWNDLRMEFPLKSAQLQED